MLLLHDLRALAGLLGLLSALVAGTASSAELLEARVTGGAETVLQSTGGTVRLERARVGGVEHPTFVPEPGAWLQLGSGIGAVAWLHARRRRRGPSHSATDTFD